MHLGSFIKKNKGFFSQQRITLFSYPLGFHQLGQSMVSEKERVRFCSQPAAKQVKILSTLLLCSMDHPSYMVQRIGGGSLLKKRSQLCRHLVRKKITLHIWCRNSVTIGFLPPNKWRKWQNQSKYVHICFPPKSNLVTMSSHQNEVLTIASTPLQRPGHLGRKVMPSIQK